MHKSRVKELCCGQCPCFDAVVTNKDNIKRGIKGTPEERGLCRFPFGLTFGVLKAASKCKLDDLKKAELLALI